MSEILLKIDGKEVRAKEGMTLLEAAQKVGISDSDTLSPREIGTLWGVPTLLGRSGKSRLDKTRCRLRLPGRKESGRENQIGEGRSNPQNDLAAIAGSCSGCF